MLLFSISLPNYPLTDVGYKTNICFLILNFPKFA